MADRYSPGSRCVKYPLLELPASLVTLAATVCISSTAAMSQTTKMQSTMYQNWKVSTPGKMGMGTKSDYEKGKG